MRGVSESRGCLLGVLIKRGAYYLGDYLIGGGPDDKGILLLGDCIRAIRGSLICANSQCRVKARLLWDLTQALMPVDGPRLPISSVPKKKRLGKPGAVSQNEGPFLGYPRQKGPPYDNDKDPQKGTLIQNPPRASVQGLS